MLGRVKQMMPLKIKRTLRATFNSWADTHPLSERVLQLEEKLAAAVAANDDLKFQVRQIHNVSMYLQHWMLTLLPEHFGPSEAGRERIARLLSRHGIDVDDVNLNVSKNDVIFQFMVGFLRREDQSVDAAFAEYFGSGLHMYQVLDAIVRRKFGSLTGVESCLDFASGYGRLARYLARALDPKRIWVSDIKPRAVQFQQEQFGVNGFSSTSHPDDLDVSQKFELIFVGSLLSHLPPTAFGGWLMRLWNMLSPRGLLIFSVNDLSLMGNPPPVPYVFNPVNGEGFTRSEDGPLNPAEFGNMFVSEEYVRGILDRLSPSEPGRGSRYMRVLWGVQDLYLVARGSAAGELDAIRMPRQDVGW